MAICHYEADKWNEIHRSQNVPAVVTFRSAQHNVPAGGQTQNQDAQKAANKRRGKGQKNPKFEIVVQARSSAGGVAQLYVWLSYFPSGAGRYAIQDCFRPPCDARILGNFG